MSQQIRKTGRGFLDRRRFVQGAVSTVAAFTVVPRHVMGGPGQIPPSERVNVAAVGVGGMGGVDLDRLIGAVDEVTQGNIVALCDVDDRYAEKTYRKFPDAVKYHDYRRMLEKEKNVDAVLVATPDHLHAVVSMMAIKMGKHVYCEKPLTRTIHEARVVAEAARSGKVATQMGNTGQAGERHRLECEWIADGAIGAVREAHVWCARPGGAYGWPAAIERPKETPRVPDGLNWELWLGPAPYRPYHPAYHPFSWRGWRDFGTGALGDIGAHRIFHVFRALKLEHPESVEVYSTKPNRKLRPEGQRMRYRFGAADYEDADETYPMACIARFDFPAREGMPPLQLFWYDGGMKPPRPHELEANRKLPDDATMYVGDKGKMLDGRLIPESKMQEFERPPKTLPRSPGHFQEWINACKGGQAAGAEFGIASLVTITVLLGNVAQRVGRRLSWDGPSLKVTNCDEANQFLHREYRAGYVL